MASEVASNLPFQPNRFAFPGQIQPIPSTRNNPSQHDPKTQTPKSPSHTHDHQINQDLVGRPQRRVSATSTSSVPLPADPAYPPQPHTPNRGPDRSVLLARVARAEENSTGPPKRASRRGQSHDHITPNIQPTTHSQHQNILVDFRPNVVTPPIRRVHIHGIASPHTSVKSSAHAARRRGMRPA
jgi:hypothetical protein